MNDLKIFNNPEFGDIRTITINNEPYFVGKDVAEILGYSKARNAIATHVDMEDKKDAPIQGPLGGTQVMTIINESGPIQPHPQLVRSCQQPSGSNAG